MTKELNRLRERVEILEKRVTDLEAKMPRNLQGSISKMTPETKSLSLTEFLKSKNARGAVQRTLVIAYYLEKFAQLKSFNVKDLESAFEQAKESRPSNINDKVNMNIRNGHLAQASKTKDGRKAWYVTRSGEEFVERNFTNQRT